MRLSKSPFALKAQATLTGGMAVLSGVNIELDGNVAEGVLSVSTEPRMTVKGTLAADALDLTPYVSTIELLRTNERDWSRGPIAIDGLPRGIAAGEGAVWVTLN